MQRMRQDRQIDESELKEMYKENPELIEAQIKEAAAKSAQEIKEISLIQRVSWNDHKVLKFRREVWIFLSFWIEYIFESVEWKTA